jgi:hypothetical protein
MLLMRESVTLLLLIPSGMQCVIVLVCLRSTLEILNVLKRINYVIRTELFLIQKKGNNVLEVQVIRRSNPV